MSSRWIYYAINNERNCVYVWNCVTGELMNSESTDYDTVFIHATPNFQFTTWSYEENDPEIFFPIIHDNQDMNF